MMPIIGSMLDKISWNLLLVRIMTSLALLLVSGFTQNSFAQTPIPLGLSNNYMVTGDYVVGGVGLRGLGDGSGYAAGAITIPRSDRRDTELLRIRLPSSLRTGCNYCIYLDIAASGEQTSGYSAR
jgi:hypothetical protein